MDYSLIVTHNKKVLFASHQHWLYPLFELEDFLKKNHLDASQLLVKDKIAGKAAACLMVHLGLKQCHVGLISQLAIAVFDRYGVSYTYDRRVDKIQCRTENLIDDEMSIADAYLFLRKRAGRVKGLPIKIKDVSLHIEGKLLIDKANLFLDRGEQLVIHGDNGAGKTTMLKAMLGFVPLTSGVIEIGDIRVGSPQWKKNRSKVAYVHQESIKNGMPITAGEVVKIGLGNADMKSSDAEIRVEVAMRRTGSFHLYHQLYETLSGGEKQRVSIARCLCQNAGVFLMDEPTSFLDQRGKEDLLKLLYDVSHNEAPTIIVVSHEHQWAERLNWQKLALKGGKLC